jgi:hypothetical protein
VTYTPRRDRLARIALLPWSWLLLVAGVGGFLHALGLVWLSAALAFAGSVWVARRVETVYALHPILAGRY